MLRNLHLLSVSFFKESDMDVRNTGMSKNVALFSKCRIENIRKNVKYVIQVVCSQDPSWWQARLLGETNIGLIPSLDLEERRQCFVDREDIKKKFSCCGSGVSRNIYKKL